MTTHSTRAEEEARDCLLSLEFLFTVFLSSLLAPFPSDVLASPPSALGEGANENGEND